MKQLFFAGLLAVALTEQGTAWASPIIYNVNITNYGITVSGTIVTDGTIGALSSNNFISWDLASIDLNPSSYYSFSISDSDPGAEILCRPITNCGFAATSTGLLTETMASGWGQIYFGDGLNGTGPYSYIAFSYDSNYPAQGANISLDVSPSGFGWGLGTPYVAAVTGAEIPIISPTPSNVFEPSITWLFGTGLCLIMFTHRSKLGVYNGMKSRVKTDAKP